MNYNDLPEMTAGEFEGVVEAFVRAREGDGEGGGGGEGCWWHFEVRGLLLDTVRACVVCVGRCGRRGDGVSFGTGTASKADAQGVATGR